MAEDDKQLVAPLEGDGKPSTTVGDGGGGVCTTIATSPSYQISREHSYPRLGPFKSTSGMVAMPTVVLFADRVRSKVAGRREKELRCVVEVNGKGLTEVNGLAPLSSHPSMPVRDT